MGLNGFGANEYSRRGMGALLGDYKEKLALRVLPATSAPHPLGPDNVPITAPSPALDANTPPWAQALIDLGNKIFDELVRQNTASIPKIRSASVDNTGETLDWSVLGFADRLMMQNLGPDPIWFQFDANGQSVSTQTGDDSFELTANSTFNPMLCKFTKIGVRCAVGKTATVHAVAFHNVAGNQNGVIS